jgi:hypothetical protein
MAPSLIRGNHPRATFERSALSVRARAVPKGEADVTACETTVLASQTVNLESQTIDLALHTTILDRQTTDWEWQAPSLESQTTSMQDQTTTLQGQTTTLQSQTTTLHDQTIPLEDQTISLERQTTLSERPMVVLAVQTMPSCFRRSFGVPAGSFQVSAGRRRPAIFARCDVRSTFGFMTDRLPSYSN